jgi:hypothetical protein
VNISLHGSKRPVINDVLLLVDLRSLTKEATYESLVGAALCIVMDGVNVLRLWALPKGACVIEFQQELEVRGDLQHLAHVCELRSWVLLLSKGDVEKQIEQELSRWLVKHEDEIKV